MTCKLEDFPVGSMVKSGERIGLILTRYEAFDKDLASKVMVAWYSNGTEGYTRIETEHISALEPCGERKAMQRIIEIVGRFLQDGQPSICNSEEDQLKDDIDTCEGVYNL